MHPILLGFGRTTHKLINLLEKFELDGIRLRSLQDAINPASVMGKAMLQIGSVFAEMERNLLRERTKAGLVAARARGRLGGRKPRLSTDGLGIARRLMADPLLTMEEMASRLGVGQTTLYRALGRSRAGATGLATTRPQAITARAPGRKLRLPPSPTKGGA